MSWRGSRIRQAAGKRPSAALPLPASRQDCYHVPVGAIHELPLQQGLSGEGELREWIVKR